MTQNSAINLNLIRKYETETFGIRTEDRMQRHPIGVRLTVRIVGDEKRVEKTGNHAIKRHFYSIGLKKTAPYVHVESHLKAKKFVIGANRD